MRFLLHIQYGPLLYFDPLIPEWLWFDKDLIEF